METGFDPHSLTILGVSGIVLLIIGWILSRIVLGHCIIRRTLRSLFDSQSSLSPGIRGASSPTRPLLSQTERPTITAPLRQLSH